MVTKLVILAVIVLGVIAVAQLMRVYELSSKLGNNEEGEISNRDNRFNANMMLIFMVVLFGGFIWLMLKYGWTGRGDGVSVGAGASARLYGLHAAAHDCGKALE